MGSQIPACNDRSRTYWTPTMERYFVDLMLEHMHKGNRAGHTFNKQAWTDMLSVFNANFGSQYDKDVLKSRYTNLWKQFNDVKNMLGQGGFSWDDGRNMVVADDYIWNAYIKAHPDARAYKTKTLLNFNDLCLIYGYTTADGRYSRSSHDMDIDDEVQGVNLGDGQESLIPSNTERSRTDWTAAMDQFFIELLLDQLGKGNKLDNSYSKQAWTDMLTSFNTKFGPQHTKRVLRHRYKKLCKYYTDIAVLLKQNGFSWDAKDQMVVANDDVWDSYIKAHPQARSYRTKAMANYKDLELIFGSAINDGSVDKYLEEDAGVKTGSERSRTHWTPPMDCYLIDLLLDQVNRGNRIAQTFVAQAWIDMVKSFNACFRSHHDKDVLKNRFKHLKRQYNDINVLLEHTGFSWDEAREMVAAEDHVWDAYIKEHPDARSYRVRTVPNYHKLCIIYGQDSSEGRYSRLARNVLLDKDVAVASIGENNGNQLFAEREENSNWMPQMDRCFVELMLEQQIMNNSVHGFDDQRWAVFTTLFNERCGQQYDKCALQNRYAYFFKQYIEVEDLLTQNGFLWDDTRQIVVANDDTWEAYIKEQPHASSYRGKVLRHHKDLCKIFGGNIMNGCFYSQLPMTNSSHSPMGMEAVEIGGDIQILPKEFETSNTRRKRVIEMPSALGRYGKVHRNGHDDIHEAFTDMANVVSELVNGKTDKNYVAIERAVDALQAIPDIDDELLLDGCDILEDEKKAKTFLALDVSLRKKWLLRKLGR